MAEPRPAWWVERPSLEYQHAFDLCAVEVHRVQGPVAVFASRPFFAREVLKRLTGCEAALVPIGSWGSSREDVGGLLGPEADAPVVRMAECARLQVRSVVWVEPQQQGGERALDHIRRILPPDGKVCVIVSGWLARFLPEWRQVERRLAEPPAGLWWTFQRLRQAGLRVETLHGFHGLSSILWSYAWRGLARLGRDDWADRCHFQMRAQYAVSGLQAFTTPVGVGIARWQ